MAHKSTLQKKFNITHKVCINIISFHIIGRFLYDIKCCLYVAKGSSKGNISKRKENGISLKEKDNEFVIQLKCVTMYR